MRSRNVFIIYPEYFDAKLSRREGRRVPLSLAVSNPRVEELALVAHRLGWKINVEPDAAYPRCWWNRRGRILVEKDNMKKTKAIVTLARILKKAREAKAAKS
ncbi:MAG: signal recognition particle subunit SRP19/SEC65 family protein [Candidatus Freyarchaeota archaeon]|nr:signal recognition particle subunit SRP19/SEC65 family protein [Candidatus Freyrarchaeum guaymaensis]HDO81432.1 signal recognition particle protein Srp19 [Candidatus Bathyarchaeota archaeon]